MPDFVETTVIPTLLCTAVGSLPHADADAAVDLIVKSLPRAPHTPQLSRSDPKEQMWLQITEGLPRFRVDWSKQSYYFDTSGDPASEVEEFYSHYLAVIEGSSAEAFAIGAEYGKGIHRLLHKLRTEDKKLPFIKVQVTGPLSFALTVTDENQKPIFYHAMFRDVAVKGMGLKAIWLLEQFKPFADNIIVFFDEPSLSAYGSSAFLGVSKADVIESLDDVISMVLDRGGIPGVHCCGNTDWGMIMETSARVINFDAINYMESMAIYGKELKRFLSLGGVIAWGAVPNTEMVEQETSRDVVRRVQTGFGILGRAGIDRELLDRHIMVTPACGCAGMTLDQAEKTYNILEEIGEKLGPEAFRG
ncbi:MAG TPA: hypothetical protein VMC85_15840 [Desulfomonilaceae bacterium]|nr:hypothetical protein [Desulfomonilaceae bacterium]